MSAKTRINRPTYATPRKLRRERFIHVSTNYVREDGPLRRFIKAAKGLTRSLV